MTIKRHSIVFAFYLLVALIALYRPLFNMATHLTGDIVTDYFQFHWNFWWVRHALTSGLPLYETNYIFAPHTSSLAYHTLTAFWYPLWAVIEPWAGTVPAMTAVFIANFTLCGFSLYLLLRRESVPVSLALVGGLLLELCPLMFNATYWTNINLMSWFWLPLLVLVWGSLAKSVNMAPFVPPLSLAERAASDSSERRGEGSLSALSTQYSALFHTLLLALILYGMVLTDIQYPLFAVFLIVPYGLLTLWQAQNWRSRGLLIGWGMLAIAIAVALLWFLGPLKDILAFDRSGLAPTPMERAVRIPFPEGFFSRLTIPQNVSFGALIVPLFGLTILLSLYRLLRHRAAQLARPAAINHQPLTTNRLFWLLVALVPLILAAGPSITIGTTELPMPYVLLHTVFGGMFRYPERFAALFTIPAALFIMKTLTPLVHRPPWRYALPVPLIFLIAADSWMYRSVAIQPIPPHYDFYDAIGREPYDYVVLEVPTGASSGESLVGEQRFAALMWYGIYHHKRMVNGHISRVNVLNFWAMRTDDPLLAWLGQRRFVEPDLVEPELRQIIQDWPLGYIVVHQDMIGRNGPTTQEIIGYLNALPDLVCPVWVERDVVVYRTSWHPDGCPPRTPPEPSPGVYRIDIGSVGDERYIGWGWHWPEVVGGATTWRWLGEYPQTRLYVDLPPGAYTVTLAAQSFWEPRTLRLSVNDVPLVSDSLRVVNNGEGGEGVTNSALSTQYSALVLPDSLQTLTFTLPADLVGQGQHLTLTLDYDSVIVPKEIGQSADERKLAVAVDWVEFRRVGP